MKVNAAVGWGLIGKLFQGLAGPVIALLIASYFSPELQGYHYTFANLLAIQVLLELGLTGVIVTFAAHESAKVTIAVNGEVSGDAEAVARLRGLAWGAFKWFLSGAVLLAGVLVVFGSVFLGTRPESAFVSWREPWLLLCAATAVYFIATPAWALLTGCGRIEQVNRYKFFETAIRAGVMCGCIVGGAGLWSAPIASSGVSLAALGFLAFAYGGFFRSLLTRLPRTRVWKSEVMPFQWRIAISYTSGYLIFSLFTPALFYFHGPVVAGQMGLSWALVGGVSGLAYTWLQVSAPEFGKLVAAREFARLDSLAKRIVLSQASIAACLGAAVFLFIWLLQARGVPLASRFLPLVPLSVFLVAETLQQVSYVQSTYLRAFKKEPFMWLSIVAAIIVGGGTLSLSRDLGALGAAASYLAGVAFSLALGSWIFVRCRRDWTFPR